VGVIQYKKSVHGLGRVSILQGIAAGIGSIKSGGWCHQHAMGEQLHIECDEFWNFALSHLLMPPLVKITLMTKSGVGLDAPKSKTHPIRQRTHPRVLEWGNGGVQIRYAFLGKTEADGGI
jgi:hypothetical protein